MSAEDPNRDVPVRDVDALGATIEIVRSFADARDKGRYLTVLALVGSRRPDRWGVQHLARELGSPEACHAYVRDLVRYADEPTEKLETAAYVARELAGDCDAQAVILGAMLISLGCSVELVLQGGTPEDPSHAAIRFRADGRSIHLARWEPFGREAPRRWTWAETTVRAELGEIPYAAAVRLGSMRADLR